MGGNIRSVKLKTKVKLLWINATRSIIGRIYFEKDQIGEVFG